MTTMAGTATTTQVHQVFIKASPQAIWDAITKPEWTERYFYGSRADFDLRAGGRYESRGGENDDVLVDGEVIEADQPRKLVHTWRVHYDPELTSEGFTRVTWELDEQDGGVTKLTVTHELEGAPKTAASVGGGWPYVLSGLKTLLETGKPLAG